MEGPVDTASFHGGKILIGLVFTSNLIYRFSFFVLPAPSPHNLALPSWASKRAGERGRGGSSRKEDDLSGSN